MTAGLNAGEITLGAAAGRRVCGTAVREVGIAAHHQTLAGETGCRDGGHVALVEQRQLQRAARQQSLDRRRTQRSDPVQAFRCDVLGDSCLGDHAAIADQHHMLKLEAPLQLIDLGRQRHRIGGVAFKDFNGDGTAVRSTEQAVDDLQSLAVAAIAAVWPTTAMAFHVARRDIVQHQRPAAEMAFGQQALDSRLTFQQPVQCRVEVVFVDLTEAEHFAQARGGRGRR